MNHIMESKTTKSWDLKSLCDVHMHFQWFSKHWQGPDKIEFINRQTAKRRG